MGLYEREESDRDLDSAQNAPVSSQFLLQWELRTMAQEAMLRGMATGKVRRIMDRNQTFNSIEITIGDSVIFYRQVSRKSTPRRRGPATILAIHETGVTVKFQSQPFTIARCCVRKRVIPPAQAAIGAQDLVDPDTLLSVEEPMDMEPKQLGCEETLPVEVDSSAPKRASAHSEISGMTDDLTNPPTNDPTLAIHI